MNREIKFRGLCVNGVNWYYGNLSILEKKFGNVEAGYYISNAAGAPFAYQVRPETVGQFIEMCDEYGNEIYHGDILSYTMPKPCEDVFDDSNCVEDHQDEVIYREGIYCFENSEMPVCVGDDLKVVGNIHVENNG